MSFYRSFCSIFQSWIKGAALPLNSYDKSVNLTYKKFAFFVRLSFYQFIYDGLNVHHKYYVREKKPWEYDDDALVTLCADCHKKRHAEEQIPVYKSLALIPQHFDLTLFISS